MRYTEAEKRKLFPEMFKNKACNVSETCKSLGIARKTWYLSIERDDILKEYIDDVRCRQLEFVECYLMEQIKGGNFQATKFYLINKSDGKWTHNGSGTRSFQTLSGDSKKASEEFEQSIVDYFEDSQREEDSPQ